MTAIERKRAKKLTDVICKMGGNSYRLITVFQAAMVVIVDAAIFFVTSQTDEIYTVMILNTVFITMFGTLLQYVKEALFGTLNIYAAAAQTGNGSFFIGKFLCTLPFEGKDRINMRIADWEKTTVVNFLITAAVMIIIEVSKSMGYSDYDGIVGVTAVVYMAINAALLMITLFVKNGFVGMITSMVSSLIPVFIMLVPADESGEITPEMAQTFSQTLEGFGFLSGVSGVVILAAFTAVLILFAEVYSSRMKKISWRFK